MQGGTYLVIAYLVVWIGLLAYLSWIALRLRGVSAELEAVRDVVDARERAAGTSAGEQ